jgi:hypothetical protein
MQWYHAICVKLHKDVLKFFDQPGVHWLCPKCNDKYTICSAKNPFDMMEQMEKLSNLQGEVSSSYCTLKSEITKLAGLTENLQSLSDSTEKNVSETRKVLGDVRHDRSDVKASYLEIAERLKQNREHMTETFEKQTSSFKNIIENRSKQERDAEFRLRNIIIFGIEEEKEKQVLCEKVKTLVKECHIDLEVMPNNLYRLGQFDSSKSSPRPLRLCTKSENQKWELLKRINI